MKVFVSIVLNGRIKRHHSLRVVPFFITLLLLLVSCSSGGLRISGGVNIDTDEVLLSGSLDDRAMMALVTKEGARDQTDAWQPAEGKKSISLLGHRGNVFYMDSEKGLLLFNKKSKKQLLIPRGEKGLKNEELRRVHSSVFRGEYRFYVTYMAPNGAGATVCSVKKNLLSFECTTYTKENSKLKNNRVHEVNVDARGNIWFRYSYRDLEGISRLKTDGTWQHFDRYNSELGDDSVYILKIEEKNRGFAGENIWFVSRAGLSRLHYDGKKEEWKLYGDKRSFGDTVSDAIGISQWFTKAIVNIVDLSVEKDFLMIANRYGVYRFEDGKVNRFTPKNIGGRNELRIRSMRVKNDTVLVFISPQRSTRRMIKAVMAFNMKERTWKPVQYWHIKKGYPVDMRFFSLDEGHDLVVMTYTTGVSRLALLSYKDLKLKLMKIPIPASPGK